MNEKIQMVKKREMEVEIATETGWEGGKRKMRLPHWVEVKGKEPLLERDVE